MTAMDSDNPLPTWAVPVDGTSPISTPTSEHIPLLVHNASGPAIRINADMSVWLAEGLTGRDAVWLLARVICGHTLPPEAPDVLADAIVRRMMEDDRGE